MTMAKRTKFQEKVIRNYYQNREAIAVQRLQELVTELYLTKGKKHKQHWKTIRHASGCIGSEAGTDRPFDPERQSGAGGELHQIF